MGNFEGCVLCSKGFMKFFECVHKNIISADKMIDIISESMHYISDELHLGKLDTALDAPCTLYDPTGENDCVELYSNPDGYDNNPYSEEFITGENGKAIMTAYPVKGYKWSEEEFMALNFLFQNLFVILGRSRLMQLVENSTMTDTLTGIKNSSGFMRFGREIQSKGILGKYTGFFINIKNFNYINQSVGAIQGDKILIKYAETINNFLESDEIAARLGGDNFILLVKNDKTNAFIDFISDIKISADNEDSRIFDISVRMGIFPIKKDSNMGEVMTCTSAALNIAKSSSHDDYVWFKPKMLEKALHDKEISLIFPSAIENREFVVYYQPKVNLSNHKLCGCEALVRWVRNGKIVPPMDFIPVLEHEGSICRLDFYVLEKVCSDIRKWLDTGIEPVRVSVNFSKIHLHDPALAEKILKVVKKYNIKSKYLEVELTEMSGYEDYDALSTFVDIMKNHGINTSIDDFGTGYSSLNLLKDLNVDIIKLDKSFLNNIQNHNRTDEVVIKNIVNMVNELNMEVIAEGVETAEQADFLKKVNCCIAQGYLFDKPLSHDDFEKRLSGEITY